MRIVLNEHNCEYKIMETNYEHEKRLLKRMFLWLETQKVKHFEKRTISKVDYVTVLTNEDYDDIKRITIKDFNHSVIPVGVPDHRIKEYRTITANGKIRLFFLGTLTWEPNNHGICWFIKNVMPVINEMLNVDLYIAGKNPSEEVMSLSEKIDNIYVKGFVEDLDELFDYCDIMIAPIFIGSGQKVKILEAFSRGCPVIATEFATRGIPCENNKNIIIADTPDAFLDSIQRLWDPVLYAEIAKECRQTYEEEFSDSAVISKIQKYVYDLLDAD